MVALFVLAIGRGTLGVTEKKKKKDWSWSILVVGSYAAIICSNTMHIKEGQIHAHPRCNIISPCTEYNKVLHFKSKVSSFHIVTALHIQMKIEEKEKKKYIPLTMVAYIWTLPVFVNLLWFCVAMQRFAVHHTHTVGKGGLWFLNQEVSIF